MAMACREGDTDFEAAKALESAWALFAEGAAGSSIPVKPARSRNKIVYQARSDDELEPDENLEIMEITCVTQVSESSASFARSDLQEEDIEPMSVTTLVISQIPEYVDADVFRTQLDRWGFHGSYDFLYMPPESACWSGKCAFVNFVDQGAASSCSSYFQQCPAAGAAEPYYIQGLENIVAHFSQLAGASNMVPAMASLPAPPWALAQVTEDRRPCKASPQIRGQFHKTKMCSFHLESRCTVGRACPYAHSKEELNSPPDLSKTKLCVDFMRKKCHDASCRFAHGFAELRATSSIYKTNLCEKWSAGSCKDPLILGQAGRACRFAHGEEELRTGMQPNADDAPPDGKLAADDAPLEGSPAENNDIDMRDHETVQQRPAASEAGPVRRWGRAKLQS